MNLQEKALHNLNQRLTAQAVIIDTLCDILIKSEIITEDELNKKINSKINSLQSQIKDLLQNQLDSEDFSDYIKNYRGVIGEA
jgi:uncharacterized coiled-coil protein SlyX